MCHDWKYDLLDIFLVSFCNYLDQRSTRLYYHDLTHVCEMLPSNS